MEAENNGLIYILKDKKGLFYIGQTTELKSRNIQHKSGINTQNKSCGSYLLDIDFTHEIIEKK